MDPNVGAVEHQFSLEPGVNTGIHSQKDLWTAIMNGGSKLGRGSLHDCLVQFHVGQPLRGAGTVFDVDGGRALALDGVEYIVYLEKPGPVEVTVKNHGYDVASIDLVTGERTKAKEYKGEHFAGEPPSRAHDWVLHISREGRKESMLKSYKLDSRGERIRKPRRSSFRRLKPIPPRFRFGRVPARRRAVPPPSRRPSPSR